MKMKTMIFIIFMVFIATPVYASSIFIVDQENPGPFETSNGSLAASFGQSFTPSLPAIDAVEFLLGGSDATVIVQLRDSLAGFDGLGGNIIAQSLPVLVDQLGSHVFLFNFTDRVFLTPGEVYVAELQIMSGSYGVRHTQNNRYPAGKFLHGGWPHTNFPNTDLVFSEGLTSPIPIPGAFWLLGSGLIGLVAFRKKRKNN